METLLKVSDLSVGFENQKVISQINFELQKGETLAVIGPNGAGKSILFRALLGLIPHGGTVVWKKGIKIGYVPQKIVIEQDLPLTTEEFFKLKGSKFTETFQALKSVGFEEHKPHSNHLVDHVMRQPLGVLSGGELQRVLIAWALLNEPDVLLFDEPTSGVDVGAEETIYELLKKLQDKRNLSVLLISHDINIVYSFANTVVCLNQKMVCYGPPRDVLEKESLTKLYGKNIGFYQHQTHHHDH